MLKEQRLQFILEQVNKSGAVSLEFLSSEIGSSYSTLRRDIEELEKAGHLLKVHGGAKSVNRSTSFEPPFEVRQDFCFDEKNRIARAARELVQPNETLLLGGGTTVHAFGKTLYDVAPLYVATNDLKSAMELSKFDALDITVLGGRLRKHHFSINGYFTDNMVNQIHADKAFIGVDAIDFDIGFMNFSTEDIQTNKCMIKASHEVIVLCDHTKFGKIAFANICHFSDVDTIITGRETEQWILDKLHELNVNTIIA